MKKERINKIAILAAIIGLVGILSYSFYWMFTGVKLSKLVYCSILICLSGMSLNNSEIQKNMYAKTIFIYMAVVPFVMAFSIIYYHFATGEYRASVFWAATLAAGVVLIYLFKNHKILKNGSRKP